jgi:hypothetical protein
MSVDDEPLELIDPLEEWFLTLTSGEQVLLFAHSYNGESDETDPYYVFHAFIEGTPLREIEIARFPKSAIADISSVDWSSPVGLAHELPFAWRITRYDPALGDVAGAFVGDTWTAISDIGQTFDGATLTLVEYERTEAAYIEALAAFADDSGIDRLEIRVDPREILSVEDMPASMYPGAVIDIEEAKVLLRAILRDEAWCKLESPSEDFYVHVGNDLYMYIGSHQPCHHAGAQVMRSGLYVEADHPSPLLREKH